MFVEIVRLLIVVLSTAAGYELSRRAGSPPDGAAVLGATIGALFGYVAGGIFGRLLTRAVGIVEEQVDRTPAPQMLAGAVGALVVGLLAVVLGAPAVVLIPGHWGWPLFGLLVWNGLWIGFRVAVRKSEELFAMIGLSTVPLLPPEPVPDDSWLVDTSSVIDGRLQIMGESGVLRGTLLVPRFVLDELQGIADAQEDQRRRKGRRGLEALEALRRDGRLRVQVVDDEVPEFDAVDAKLVALARRKGVSIVTVDHNLQKVAEIQGVTCLNVHRLAEGLRPVVVPGEVLRLPIAREGKEPGQGVGFLDDGTMVVVGDAAGLVGRDVDVRVTSNVQTSVGRMLFASVEQE